MKGKEFFVIMITLPMLNGMGFSHQPSLDVSTWDRFAFDVAGTAIEVKMPPNTTNQHTREVPERPSSKSIYVIKSYYDLERTIFTAPGALFELHLELRLFENEADYTDVIEYQMNTARLRNRDSIVIGERKWDCAEYEFSPKDEVDKVNKIAWECFTKIGEEQGLYVRGLLDFFDHRLSMKFIGRRREIFDEVVKTVEIVEANTDH